MRRRSPDFVYNDRMSNHVIHVSETEARNDFASLLDRVRAGAEVLVEETIASTPEEAERRR